MPALRLSAPWWARLLATLGFFVAAAVGFHAFGVAGFRGGFLWCGLVLAGAGGVLTWRLLGPRFPGRTLWVVAAVVAAVATTGWLVDHAPLSHPRLADKLDDLQPPFTRVLRETETGRSSCRPRCPTVERLLRAPPTAPFGAILDVASRMRLEGLLPDLIAVGREHPTRFLRVPGERYTAEVRVVARTDHLRLTLRLTATRGRDRDPPPPQMAATVMDRTRLR